MIGAFFREEIHRNVTTMDSKTAVTEVNSEETRCNSFTLAAGDDGTETRKIKKEQ